MSPWSQLWAWFHTNHLEVEMIDCMANKTSRVLSVSRLFSKRAVPVHTPISKRKDFTSAASSTFIDVIKLLKITNLMSINLGPFPFQIAFLCLRGRLTSFFIFIDYLRFCSCDLIIYTLCLILCCAFVFFLIDSGF